MVVQLLPRTCTGTADHYQKKLDRSLKHLNVVTILPSFRNFDFIFYHPDALKFIIGKIKSKQKLHNLSLLFFVNIQWPYCDIYQQPDYAKLQKH